MGTNKRANSDVQDPDGQDDISTKRTRLDGSDLSQAHSHVVKEALAELTRDAYTVGWICALPVEQAAAVAMLDIEHKCPPVHKDDTNNYALGRIGMHNIAIACMSSYGSVNAAFVASHMIRTFPSIRIGLMVGIGGGVPARNDVRLGDIVVSHPTATSTGVEQYDSGKTEKGGLFKQTGKLNKPPQELLTAVAVLKAHHESRLSQIPAILAGLEKQKPRIVYPGVEHDRLFEADYEHQGSSCTDCDPSRLVKREARPDNNPRIHYGAIASANQVMKHGKTRDCIADELNVLCFEMEAAGLMDNFPCLVIRGICDYADSHKAKEWQPYAAAVAAAYAKELLLITHTHEVQNAVVTPSLNARSTVEVKKHRHLLLESLKFEKIDSRHDNIKKAHAKTCQWLMQHPDYADWQDVQKFGEHHGILWISGKPGAGKSTIMKFAVSQASQHGQGTVISFFFNARGEDLEKTVLGLYRSLLYQLLKNIPDLQSVLDDQSAPPLGKDMTCSWSPHKLKSLLLKVIEQLGTHRVTCFIDALDECAEKEVREMLSFFEELGECAASSKTLLYACFSSRHYPHVHIDHGLKLTLEAQAGHAKDLEDYVRTKLKNEDGESPQTMEIVEEIIRKASGVFMWVVLVIDILNREFQKGRMFAVRQRLATIPERLSDLFRDMLVRDNENMDDFRLCIQWVLYSRRPLKRREYYFAMVSGLYPERLEHQCAEKISEEAMDRFVIDSSKGLAETTATPETTDMEPTVQFIHESVRDFLLKDNGIQVIWPEAAPDFEATSNEKLKSCCSSFIKITDLGLLSLFDRVPKPLSKALKLGKAPLLRRELTKGYPFAEYAIRNLFHHADHAAGSTPQIDFMTDFSSTDRADWIVIYNVLQKYEKRRLHETVSLLCILAIHNSACLIRQYLHHDLQERWPRSWPTMENYCTPLHAAIFEDSEDAAVALLSRNGKYLHKVLPGLANEGVDVDHSDSKGRTALLLAAEKGQDRVVKKLLRLGADMTHETEKDQTPLSVAIKRAHASTTMIFVTSDAFRQNSTALLQQAVFLALSFGRHDIAETLLEHALHVDAGFGRRDPRNLEVAVAKNFVSASRLLLKSGAHVSGDSLRFAVRKSRREMVEILLDGDTDVNSSDERGYTALHLAAELNLEAIAQILLEKGANVQKQDESGRSPLCVASAKGNLSLADVLILGGADVNRADSGGHNALWRAVWSGHVMMAKLLLVNGADIHCAYAGGQTLLHIATQRRKHSVAGMLLAHGARVNQGDQNGRTPLHYAQYSVMFMKKLINNGADVNSRDDTGETPIFSACRDGNLKGTRLLLENGAEVNLTANNGETAFLVAVAARRTHIIRELIDYGATMKIPNIVGKTAMSKFLNTCTRPWYSEHFINARALLDGGASAMETNSEGLTILHMMCREYIQSSLFRDLTRKVLSSGADVNARDNDGRTPILLAVKRKRLDLVETLLEYGADPNLEDNRGSTPLYEAIIDILVFFNRATFWTVSALVRGGADPDTRTPDGLSIRNWVLEMEDEPGLKDLKSLIGKTKMRDD